MCRQFWRGQKYCSIPCSIEARRRSWVKSLKKYRVSRRGRLKQARAQFNAEWTEIYLPRNPIMWPPLALMTFSIIQDAADPQTISLMCLFLDQY